MNTDNHEKVSNNIAELGIDIFDEPAVETSVLTLDKENHLLLFKVKSNTVTANPADVILTTENNTKIKVKYTVYTVYDDIEESEDVLLLCNIVADEIIVKAVFEPCSFIANKSLKTINWYFNRTFTERAELKKRLKYGKKYSEADVFEHKMNTVEDFEMAFDFLKTTFDEKQQRDIVGMLHDARFSDHDKRQQTLKKLHLIMNSKTVVVDTAALNKKPSELKKIFDSKFAFQEKAKKEIIEMITMASFNTNRGFVAAFVGPSGIGKSSFAECISDFLDRDFIEIHCDTLSSGSDISGHDSTFHNSDASDLLMKRATASSDSGSVICFSEVDKALSSSENGNIKNIIAAILDKKQLYDNFIRSHLTLEDDIILLDLNDESCLPSHLIDRIPIIHFEGYSVDEKFQIAKKHIIKRIFKENSISEKEIIFEDDALYYLIENYTCDSGARKTEQVITSIVRNVLSVWKESGKRKKTVVTKHLIDSVLDERIDRTLPAFIFHKNKTLYKDDIRIDIEKKLTELSKPNLEQEKRELLEKQLRILVKICEEPELDKKTAFNPDNFLNLMKSYIGREDMKKRFVEHGISEAYKKNSKGRKVKLLVGNPGLGKTYIAKQYALSKNLALVKIPCASITSKSDFVGLGSSYKEPDAGLFMNRLNSISTDLILLDEIDKISYDKHGENIVDCLLDILDNGEIYNALIEKTIKLNNEMILTANDLSKIPQPILDRCEIYNFSAYTPKERQSIFEKCILKNLSESYDVEITLSNEVCNLITNVYNTSSSIRQLEESAQRLVERAFYKVYPNETNEIIIDEELVKETLKKPIRRGNIPEDILPGISVGLAVNGDGSGICFAIESAFVAGGNGDLRITGLPEEDVRASCELVLSQMKNRFPDIWQGKTLHVHYGEGSIPKKGSSAGSSTYLSVLSLILGRSTKGFTSTGEIDLFGFLHPVGGIQEKIRAAQLNRQHTVFIPKGNKEDITTDFVKEMDEVGLKIIPVSHTREIDEIVFKDK